MVWEFIDGESPLVIRKRGTIAPQYRRLAIEHSTDSMRLPASSIAISPENLMIARRAARRTRETHRPQRRENG
jgi:hypothetical protein